MFNKGFGLDHRLECLHFSFCCKNGSVVSTAFSSKVITWFYNLEVTYENTYFLFCNPDYEKVMESLIQKVFECHLVNINISKCY